MRIVTGSEMKKIDEWAIKIKGMPALLLMENAGQAVACEVKKILGNVRGSKVVILAGKGNNGGDALVAARHLFLQGAEVELLLFYHPAAFQGAVQENWRQIIKHGIRYRIIEKKEEIEALQNILAGPDIIIDGIFGTGFYGQLPETVKEIFARIRESAAGCILAIDIPSGLNADTGKIEDDCLQADVTVTMAWPKIGLVVFPGKKCIGRLVTADIGIPQEGLQILEKETYYVNRTRAASLVPVREWDSHKNTFGHLLVVAGSSGMLGAAFLASKAGLRAGAGLVTAVVPKSLAPYFDAALPEAIIAGVEETKEQVIAKTAWQQIKELIPGKKALVFGPGIKNMPQTKEILMKILECLEVPLVLDADGLNILADNRDIVTVGKAPLVLTPHPAEMGRLLGMTTGEVQANRTEAVLQAAQVFGAVVVLKGADTVVADPTGKLFINSTGSPVLATAGTGDVLAGVIGGLLAQGLTPIYAAVLGVFIHGLAGDYISRIRGERGILAGDIVEVLPQAYKNIRG